MTMRIQNVYGDFLRKATKLHYNKYDYSKVDYINAKTKVAIICPEHGEFKQIPNAHLNGQGCPKCGGGFMDTEFFKEKATKLHCNKYDYAKVDYINAKTKVAIICPEHGEFKQIPNAHLNGQGCPKCGGGFMDTEFFKEKATKLHCNKYDYSKVDYINHKSKVIIGCKLHGDFLQSPDSHIQGQGCPRCSLTGFKYNKPGYLYYIKDNLTSMYKIGITNLEVNKRFTPKTRFNIIKTWYFKKGIEAYIEEQTILEKYSDYRVINELWENMRGGKTEFFSEDVLHLDNGGLLQ